MAQSTVPSSRSPVEAVPFLDTILSSRLIEAVMSDGDNVRILLIDDSELVLTGAEAAKVRQLQDQWIAEDDLRCTSPRL